MYSQLYLDYNATTPCSREVIDAMSPYFGQHFGNPSSSHHPFGWLAKSAVEDARNSMAENLGVAPAELIFTSGATESINAILKGVVGTASPGKKHIITTKAEHKAVLDTCAFLQTTGVEVTYLDVDSRGLIPMEEFRKALRPDTALVAVMYANNETGIIQPLEEIAELTHGNGSLLFSDTTQVLGKVAVNDVLKLVDFACFSGHKVYGPKGIGLLYTKNNSGYDALPSFIQGGGQQKGQRGGTLNTPLIVGMAKAIELASRNLEEEQVRLTTLRDQLDKGLSAIELAISNNAGVERLPNTSHFSFPYVDGASLLTSLGREIAVSNGSACNSASVEPSHVLLSMGIERSLAYASIRLSLGAYTTKTDIEKAVEIISKAVARQREDNILWERRKQV
ncbi:cysteine desulfurase family protein [Robiginitalea aurantiaca]|uniref:cysteine desulfurase n=1 Tax=Robiginitalea aurantiaca TaxID=3056915 RepID=A0ABT7WFP4_9FLAO|nr:cysteine desulfurase family protein [Robiginitalea aurantiaca]MDM9631741.1 cysteine desulfurase family protein [Robiginitalea aurantiaca]